MNIKDFLNRIQFEGKAEVSLACLSELQEKFVRSVPFENTYIMKNIPLDYEYQAVFHKIVEKRRGGVCYENNALFFWALSEIGFKVQYIAAEMFPAETLRNKFDHMALLVNLDGNDYLVDVGNGKHYGFPINIKRSDESIGEGVRYRIQQYNDDYLVLCLFEDDEWKYRYAFNTDVKHAPDFKKSCEFTQTSPDSSFTKDMVVTRLNQEYRATLSGLSFTKTFPDHTKEKRVISAVELDSVLLSEFGLGAL
ncbi:arylamine N-acetyltransferase family protein [Enterovibrio calviensis]|uniref:arylamine N-acetyltransferase family protein n=1 Tax=Enterovibrio calviensis TaxID=91359 RepID=UPI000485433B|nr:arylamine N-acetyltransferase [Enterovibrio calviensis]